MIHLQPYIPCSRCGKKAAWSYMPGNWDYCDDCVPRGCSCNHWHITEAPTPSAIPDGTWKWLKENEIWTEIDAKGRQEPCCEYSSIPDERHDDKVFLDIAWEQYYKEHEDQRPVEVPTKILVKFKEFI